MNKKLFCVIVFSCMLLVTIDTHAQLTINGASFTIEPGATVTVQGNMSSTVDIAGSGKIQMKAAAPQAIQTINMNGFSIPNLEIDNTANVSLTGNAKIASTVLFTNGKLQIGNNTLTLSPGLTASGMAANKFIETNGTGFVRREINADISNIIVPVGTGADYTPLSLTNTGSTYSAASIDVQAKGIADPNKHPRAESYLTVYWPINKTGISNGTTTAVGTYTDPTRVTGTEANLVGMYWNGSSWSKAGGTQSAALNTAGATISGATGELYAMNTFLLVAPRVFLQGAYNTGGLMNDKLRNSGAYVAGTLPASNIIPTTDPYRTAPYNFTETNNAVVENVISTNFPNPFIDQVNPNNNIVDWVFLELRSGTTPGNTILQTRSALLQRDGDIVDVDGVSPVYFKTLAAGSYTLAVRHRNHLAMSTNPASFTKALDLASSGIDFSNIAATSLMGTANANYFNNGSLNMLYAGNVTGNGFVRYQGTNGPGAANVSDRIALLNDLGSNELNTLSTYQRGDVTMNRVTRYQGTNGPGVSNVSDRIFILTTVLANLELATKSEALPN